ncbi:ABC transporter substrate-binding protein [Arhodomonas aquaeolei]|uniref:ABC transporter substrate-binding protein n=1 Tax=Arhodomonas aquaeolei TaxID=2369 RepID=UPI0003A33F1A|nr:ABC transporter substrate-binding protein [Arhodomonas aquaeolei]
MQLRNWIRNCGFLWAVGATVALGAAGAASAADFPETDKPIRLTLNDWTGQNVSTRIMGGVLEEMGYEVDYVQADYMAQFTGLKSGDLTVAMEIWETTAKDLMEEAVAGGKVLDMGETGMRAVEDWWYPKYMEERCPGLPDWEALKDCADVFATPTTQPKGRYLGGAVTWDGHAEERIEALDLPFEVVHSGTEAALMAEIQSAYQRKAPILAWLWTPHWAPQQFEGEWVRFPKYGDGCYDDPSWGINPDATYDCGNPRGWIKKVAWAGGEDVWPAAYTAIRNFHIENDEMGRMIGAIDVDGRPLQTVVDKWMAENEDTWRSWIPAK